MGLLDRIFGRKAAVPPGANEEGESVLTTDEVRKLLDKTKDEAMGQLARDAMPKCLEMQEAIKSFEASLIPLSESTPDAEMDNDTINQRILSNAVAGRRNFLEKAHGMVKGLKRHLASDADSILDFQRSSMTILGNMNDTALADYRLFSGVFRKESESVFGSLKRINSLFKELCRKIDEGKRKADSTGVSKAELERMMEDISSLQSKRSDANRAERKLEELKGAQSRLKDGISRLECSEESKKLARMIEDEKELKARASKARGELSHALSRLEKPLRKYRKLVDEGTADFGDKRYIQLFLEDPAGTVLEYGMDKFKPMLEGLKKSIAGSGIDLKERSEKAMATIDTLSETDYIGRMAAEIKRLSMDSERLGKDISMSKVKEDIRRLGSELESIGREADGLERDIPKERSVIERIDASVAARKEQLEGRLASLTGKRVKVSIAV